MCGRGSWVLPPGWGSCQTSPLPSSSMAPASALMVPRNPLCLKGLQNLLETTDLGSSLSLRARIILKSSCKAQVQQVAHPSVPLLYPPCSWSPIALHVSPQCPQDTPHSASGQTRSSLLNPSQGLCFCSASVLPPSVAQRRQPYEAVCQWQPGESKHLSLLIQQRWDWRYRC